MRFSIKRFRNRTLFISWLHTLPASLRFDYDDCGTCLFAVWAAECGMMGPNVGSTRLCDLRPVPMKWYDFSPWQMKLSSAMAGQYPSEQTADQLISLFYTLNK